MDYKSSVLRCDAGECGCPVCDFIQGNRDAETMLRVIEVLDYRLAEDELLLKFSAVDCSVFLANRRHGLE